MRVAAERPETLALLQRDQRELDRALTAAGIGTEGLSIGFALSGGEGGGRREERGGQPRPRRDSLFAGPAETNPLPRARQMVGLLDIAI